LEIQKTPYLFSSDNLIELMQITESVKTRLAIIQSVGPRLSDPKAKSEVIIGLFRYADEKKVAEDVLKARAQSLVGTSTYSPPPSGVNIMMNSGGRGNTNGGRGGRGGRGSVSTASSAATRPPKSEVDPEIASSSNSSSSSSGGSSIAAPEVDVGTVIMTTTPTLPLTQSDPRISPCTPSPSGASSPRPKSLAALFPGTPISSTDSICNMGIPNLVANKRLSLKQDFSTPVQDKTYDERHKSLTNNDTEEAAALSSGLVKERRKSFMGPSTPIPGPQAESSSVQSSPYRRQSLSISPLNQSNNTPASSRRLSSTIAPMSDSKSGILSPENADKKIVSDPSKLRGLAGEKPLGIAEDHQPILSYQELLRRNFTKEYDVSLETPSGEPITVHLKQENLESYLSPDDFLDVFKVSRSDFLSFPKWKQVDLKKRANLF
jgi:hypothetical protein